MKFSIKKRSIAARIATFAIIAGGTGFATYTVMPNKKVAVVQKTDQQTNIIDENTYFGKFVKGITNVITSGEESEFKMPGFNATLQDVEVTWPSTSGLSMNDIKVDGLINGRIRSLQDFDLTVDLAADYNGQTLDLGIGLVDKTIYLAVKDLLIKSSHSNTVQFAETIDNLFFNPENPNGLGINFDFGAIVDTLINGFDLSSLSLDGFSLTETVNNDLVNIDLGIMEGISLKIVVDKETLGLRLLDFGTIKIGDVTIKGKIVCDTSDDLVVYAFDDPNYAGKARGEFVELINYVGWADRILNLLQTKKVGLALSASLSLDKEDETVSKLCDINASLNVDADGLFDFGNINLNDTLSNINIQETEEPVEEEGESVLDKVLDNLKFDGSIVVNGKNDEECANMSLAYFDRAGYFALNENEENAVMRAKIDVDVVSDIINKVPDLIESISNETEEASEDAEGLFDFVTSSALVTAIKDGMYDGILGLIKTIKNTNTTIEIEVSLASLGFGNDAVVKLVLNADEDAVENGNRVLSIAIENAEISTLNLDLELTTMAYSDAKLNAIQANKNKYDDMSFVSGVFDQVSTILDTKSAYAGIEGSVLDSAGLGFTFNGWAQFDYGTKYGFGTATFVEYKTDASKVSATHKVDIDVDNSGNDPENQNMLFEYRDKLRGKFTVQTLNDIIDLVKDLIATDDARFTKFIDPIKDMLLTGVLKEVIENEDYLQLAKSTFIKSIAQNSDGSCLNVVIDKGVLSLDNDLTLRINFDMNNNRSIESIEVLGLALGEKNIYLKISLDEYKENLTTPVSKNETFYNFSDIAVLLEFGINTTELNVYHLVAPLSIVVLDIVPLNIKLDFYIQVDGATTKVYGKIPSIPWLTDFASDDLGSVSVSSEFVFEPDHNASDNDIGGYFHILRKEDAWLSRNDGSYYYRADSKTFLDNIVEYLLCDMLNFRHSIYEKIGDIGSSEPVEDSNYEDIFTDRGFTYTHTDTKDTWSMGINLAALTGVSALGDLNLDLNGVEVSGKGYFSTADIELTIASMIKITGTITLENPNPETTSWPSTTEARYQKIIGLYNNLSQSEKNTFDSTYMNKPSNGKRLAMM